MANEKFNFRGDVYIEKNGILVRELRNLVVNAGLNAAMQGLFGTQVKIIAMGIGSSTTAPAPTQTALVAQLGARLAFDSAASIVGAVTTCVRTFAAGVSTGTVTEAGLFSALTGGTMFSRVTFAAIPKTAVDELKVTWTITASAT